MFLCTILLNFFGCKKKQIKHQIPNRSIIKTSSYANNIISKKT